MKFKTIAAAGVILSVALSLAACGVPKPEHEKVVKELEQANAEKASLAEQLETAGKEKEAVSKQAAALQDQVKLLRKEIDALKARLSPKKPAAKPPAKK